MSDDMEDAAIEALVDGDVVKSLKETNGNQHQQRLLLLVKKLSNYIAKEKGKDEVVFWDDFEGWVKRHPTTCNKLATLFACEYLKEREHSKSVKQQVDYLLIAFKKWGIVVKEKLVTLIDNKKRKWDVGGAVRLEENKKKKSAQYVNVKEFLPAIITYMGNTTVETFREHVRKARETSGGPFTKTALIELNTVANLGADAIKLLLLKTRAFLLVAKVTGLRWVAFQRMTRDNVTWRDGSLLIEYKKKHNSKEVFGHVAAVPNVNPADCGVLAFAQYVVSVPECEFPFVYSHGTSNSKARARVAALLDLVAWAVGSAEGLGYKKSHALRSYCSSFLAEKSVGTIERHEHLGWSSGGNAIEIDHYLDGAILALHSRVPLIAAGRGAGEAAPAFWQLVDTTTGDVWKIIAELSVAAKVAPVNFFIPVSEALIVKVQRHATSTSAAIVKTPTQLVKEITYLKQKVVVLEREVQLLKGRLGDGDGTVGVGAETVVEATARLTGIITELCKHAKEKYFPRQCLVAYNDTISPMLSIHHGHGFILKFSSGVGKSLQAVLIIAACQKQDPIGLQTAFDAALGSKSWLGWVRGHKGLVAILDEVPTSTVASFKEYFD
jgi:hypothetical protein